MFRFAVGVTVGVAVVLGVAACFAWWTVRDWKRE